MLGYGSEGWISNGLASEMQSARHMPSQGKLAALLRLTRWREHVPFTIPLTVVGGLLAVEPAAAAVDWRLIMVLAGNALAMSFAFMINDIEDAPDDARDPAKRAHNVISSGLLSRREGQLATAAAGILAFLLFAAAGAYTLLLGAIMLALCYLYSAHPFRFKARPLTDVVSHALMLSGLIVATGFFAYDRAPGAVWLVIAAASLFSAYGQFYNQVADFNVDQQAGLRNTAALLGVGLTSLLGHASIALALVCMVAAILQGLFPVWLGTILLLGAFTCLLFPWEMDMRGNLAQDGGNMQRPGLIVANLAALCWLASNLGWLTIM